MAEKREKLWGIKIWGDDGHYFYTEVEISQSLTHYVPTEATDPYNSQYPWVTHNGIASYYKGSCTGNFSDNQSTDCYEEYNFDENIIGEKVIYNTIYMNTFIKWLHNRKTKYLQLSENMVIPIAVLDSIQWETEKSIDDGHTCKVSFDWVQVGDEFSLLDTDMISYCPSCGTMIAPTASFCQKCGSKVNENG